MLPPPMPERLPMRTRLTLFSTPDHVTCHRVRLILSAKGISYDLVIVDPLFPPEDLHELNPDLTLPTLAERELVLYTTGALTEYLDERYPHPTLLPVDPISRARIRLAIWRIENEWVPPVLAIQTGTKSEATAARKRLRELLTAAIPLFKASKFLLNSEISLADCALAPIIWRLQSLGVVLSSESKPIVDYGNRIFRSTGFARSLTPQERELRELPE